MRQHIFVTATDTGAGKTYITSGLARSFRKQGMNVGVMKPVETDCKKDSSGALVPADAVALMKAAATKYPLDLVNPYRFSPPLSPNIAARLVRKKIEFKKIKESYAKLEKECDVMLVEGAGGIMSLVTDEKTNADLARHLGLPVLIVVPSRLGAVNQALMAVAAARASKVSIMGIVLNSTVSQYMNDRSIRYNSAEIERLARVKVLGITAYKQIAVK